MLAIFLVVAFRWSNMRKLTDKWRVSVPVKQPATGLAPGAGGCSRVGLNLLPQDMAGIVHRHLGPAVGVQALDDRMDAVNRKIERTIWITWCSPKIWFWGKHGVQLIHKIRVWLETMRIFSHSKGWVKFQDKKHPQVMNMIRILWNGLQ